MHRRSPSKLWRKFGSRYSLIGNKSNISGKSYFPPVNVEPENGNTELKIFYYKKEAKLVAWSTVQAAPEGFERYKPYIVAILELEDGERLTSQIVDVEVEKLKRGDILVPTFRKIYADGDDGIIHYGLKWTKIEK